MTLPRTSLLSRLDALRRPDSALRHRAGIVLAAVLVLAYSAWVLGYVFVTPELGVRCAFTPVVNHFYPSFLATEGQIPLEPGDRVTRIGPHSVETWSQLLRATMTLAEKVPDEVPNLAPDDLDAADSSKLPPHLSLDGRSVVRVEYERPGEDGTRSVWLRFGRSPPTAFAPSVVWFFLEIGLFVVGAILFWKKPDDPTSARFYWLCIVTLGAYMGGYHWSRIVTQPVLLFVFMACAVLLPAVTLHFYLVFPRIKPAFERRWPTALAVIYGVPLFFLFLLLQGYLRLRLLHEGGLFAGVETALDDPASAAGVRLLLVEMLWEIYAYFAVAALWFLGCFVALVHSYRTAANPAERDQVRWILYGAAAAGVPISYTLYMAVFEQGRFGGGGATWPMFAASAFVTLAYSFSMTRYRLMQLDRMISSGAVYFLISTLAGLAYYGVVFGGFLLVGVRGGGGPSLWQVVGVSSTALVLLVALDVLRGRVLHVLDKHLRREKYQLDRTLARMSQTIEGLVDAPTLGRQVLHTTADLMAAPTGSIFLREGDPALFRLRDALGPTPKLNELPPGCPLIDALSRTGAATADGTVDAVSRQLMFLGGAVAVGMAHEGALQGVLILGPRGGGEPYTAEEVQILTAFAKVAVLAIVSAEGHRTIDALNRDMKTKVEKIAEQQRRIVALQSRLTEREVRREVAPEPAESVTTEPADGSGLVGSSDAMRRLLALVRRVAASSSAVLLRGESGTGKELLAKALHDNSPRAGKAFVKVHCAALSPGLLESELFGHVKGAFTSAIRDKVGRFESADGGTLFLDEIGDISLEVQTKLLRVLEEMTFERVGSSEPVRVDVRIIAATHRPLEQMIRAGTFREDLFFRLNVLPIDVPPLRERPEDVAELALHFLRVYAAKLGKPVRLLDDDALSALKGYHWPGNIRQLENVIERAVVIAEGDVIAPENLPAEVAESAEEFADEGDGEGHSLPAVYDNMLERAERERREREILVRALASADGNKSEAARALGLARSTLVSKLKRFGLR